jgi:hypothetical protein
MSAGSAGSSGSARSAASVGLSVTHRRYVSHSHAHNGGSLVDGAYVLGLFGDVGTERPSAALVLPDPIVVVTATGTVVVPPRSGPS